MNRIVVAQVSDTTGADSSNAADSINKFLLKSLLILYVNRPWL